MFEPVFMMNDGYQYPQTCVSLRFETWVGSVCLAKMLGRVLSKKTATGTSKCEAPPSVGRRVKNMQKKNASKSRLDTCE